MHSHDPSENGGVAPKPEQFNMELEPVDPNELNLDDIPTVEAVREVEAAGFRKPGFGFWTAVLWCLLAFAVSQGAAIYVIVPAILGGRLIGEELPADRDAFMSSPFVQTIMQIAFLVSHVVSIGFCFLILRRKLGKKWHRKIAFRLPSLEHVVLVLIGLPALIMVLIPIERLVQLLPLPSLMNAEKMIASWPCSIAILLIGVGPAIWEELWFRGFITQGVTARYGNLPAIIIVSFLFGLVHLEPRQAIGAMMLGVILHLAFIATKSILIPIMIHFLNNSLVVLSATKTLPFLDSLVTAYDLQPPLALISASSVLAIVGFLLYRSRARIVTPGGAESAKYQRSHVELPVRLGPDRVESGSLAVVEIGFLIVLVGFFVAVWFGV